MFLYREVKHTDLPLLTDFFTKHQELLASHMAYIHNSMLLEIDNQIYGFAAYQTLSENTAKLSYVLICSSMRGKQMGDGLVKALLNMAELRGISVVFSEDCAKGEANSFMDAIGFDRINEGERLAFSELEAKPSLTHVAFLPEYFKTACKSKRKKAD